MAYKEFGVWSDANQEFLSTGHQTPGDALIDMLDLLRDLPDHDLVKAAEDVSVREVDADGNAGEQNLSTFVGPVVEALQKSIKR